MRNALFALAASAALTGCLDASDPEADRAFGSLSLVSGPAEGGASVRPSAFFFLAPPSTVNVPNSRFTSGTCGNPQAFTEPPAGGPPLGELSAGEALTLTVSGTAVTLPRTGLEEFAYQASSAITFTPGDSARLDVPGEEGQFPAFTLAVKTAEAFVLEPVGVPAVGDDMAVRWTPAGDTSSAMLISLRYAAPNTTTINQEIFCDARDTGEIDVSSVVLNGWREAGNGLRQVVATRARTAELQGQGSLLHIYSSYVVTQAVTAP